jgi:hypothetical protein
MAEDGAVFPARCVLCDEPVAADGAVKARLVPDMIQSRGVVVAKRYPELIGKCGYTGPVVVHVHLCGRHRRRWLYACLLAGALMLASVVWWGYLVRAGQPIGARWLVSVLPVVMGAAIAWNLSVGCFNPWVKAFRFRDRHVWLSGANPSFVARLPEVRRAGEAARGGVEEGARVGSDR